MEYSKYAENLPRKEAVNNLASLLVDFAAYLDQQEKEEVKKQPKRS